MSRLNPLIGALGFAEAPRWHGGKLWLVDFFSRQVLRAGLDGTTETVATLEGMPGGLGFLPDGTPLVVSQLDFRLLRIEEDGRLSTYADLSGHCVGAANELLVDSHGRAWVGHHGFDFFGGAEPRPSSLLRVDPDGSVHVAAEGLIFPNGTDLLPDGRTLVVAESFANRLTAFDLGADGTLSNRRVFAELGDHTPDGIATMPDGSVWLGSPMTGAFVRVAEGGPILDEVKTEGGRWAVACALVDDGRTLACVSADTSIERMPRGDSTAFVELLDLEARA